VTRPELGPVQALVLGAVLGTLTKLEGEEGVLADVKPVTDEQGFTDTILAAGSTGGERLVVRVAAPGVAEVLRAADPDRLREDVEALLVELARATGPDEALAYVERVAERMRDELAE
jgi:hypothetical protein